MLMKPFLILQHRSIDEASDDELHAFVKYGDLKNSEIRRVRMEQSGIPDIDLKDYSAIICGGGPSNVSDPEEKKSPQQIRFESDLLKLYDEVFRMDFPFLGACYGIGSLVKYQGGDVSKKKYSEDVGSAIIYLNINADDDPLTQGLPKEFKAFIGHKESCQDLPENAILLASSKNCPYQMIRFKKNIYATQFHPELDNEGLALRIRIYKDHGYFEPHAAQALIKQIKNEMVSVPEMILRRFVERYRVG